MTFRANPLSLSIPQGEVEAWLSRSGSLFDRNTTHSNCNNNNNGAGGIVETVSKVVRINPVEKVTAEQLYAPCAPWTLQFFGRTDSYSLPPLSLLETRIHHNVARFAPNYIRLSLLIFACFLYSMPLALLGLVSILGLWETLRVCSIKYGIQNHDFLHGILFLTVNILTAILMIYSKVAMAFCWAGVFSFTVFFLHSSLKNTETDKPPQKGWFWKWKIRNQ